MGKTCKNNGGGEERLVLLLPRCRQLRVLRSAHLGTHTSALLPLHLFTPTHLDTCTSGQWHHWLRCFHAELHSTQKHTGRYGGFVDFPLSLDQFDAIWCSLQSPQPTLLTGCMWSCPGLLAECSHKAQTQPPLHQDMTSLMVKLCCLLEERGAGMLPCRAAPS